MNKGLSYFSHDCNHDEKMMALEIEHGVAGYCVYFKLLEMIYGNGAYIEMNDSNLVYFIRHKYPEPIDPSQFEGIVEKCVSVGLFDKKIWQKYRVLTSRSIQERYRLSVKRRKVFYIPKNVDLINDSGNSEMNEMNELEIRSKNTENGKMYTEMEKMYTENGKMYTETEKMYTETPRKKERKKERIYIVHSVVDHWNQKNVRKNRIKDVSKLKSGKRKLTTIIDEIIDSGYTVDEIKKAIDNYSLVISSDDYYFSYRWHIADFMQRGFMQFVDESCFTNFRANKIGDAPTVKVDKVSQDEIDRIEGEWNRRGIE